jgi:conjugative transposon TraM protein
VKIDFKQPKYVLPAIAFPFLFLFYMIMAGWGSKPGKQTAQLAPDSAVRVDQINPDMPDVSKEVAGADIKNKFQSLQDAYKYEKDYSALNGIEGKENNANKNNSLGSAYTQADIQKLEADRSLDSLKKVIEANKQKLSSGMNRMLSANNNTSNDKAGSYYSPSQRAQDVMNELQKIKTQNNPPPDYNHNYNQLPPAENTDRMKDFREQMRIVDSMQKSNTAASTAKDNTRKDKTTIDPASDTSFKPLPVSLAGKTADGFNTVREFQPAESIRAIIDQDEKVYAGTRIRIRLLDDINVGENLIPKGTYIYGVISGFQTQRVNISITEIMYQNNPLPVSLDVFDNDGYLGLYVPASNFREFSKAIGTQGTNGLSSVQVGNGDLTSSLIEKVFTTTGNSVSNIIKKDKAFLKYNYIIYLKEKKK